MRLGELSQPCGAGLGYSHCALSPLEPNLMKIWTDEMPRNSTDRAAERRKISLPARITWKDQRGTTRFASVVTRDVSEIGVYVECQSAVAIPLYRLVQFQLERETRSADPIPAALKHGRVLTAVYRV